MQEKSLTLWHNGSWKIHLLVPIFKFDRVDFIELLWGIKKDFYKRYEYNRANDNGYVIPWTQCIESSLSSHHSFKIKNCTGNILSLLGTYYREESRLLKFFATENIKIDVNVLVRGFSDSRDDQAEISEKEKIDNLEKCLSYLQQCSQKQGKIEIEKSINFRSLCKRIDSSDLFKHVFQKYIGINDVQSVKVICQFQTNISIVKSIFETVDKVAYFLVPKKHRTYYRPDTTLPSHLLKVENTELLSFLIGKIIAASKQQGLKQDLTEEYKIFAKFFGDDFNISHWTLARQIIRNKKEIKLLISNFGENYSCHKSKSLKHFQLIKENLSSIKNLLNCVFPRTISQIILCCF